MAGSSVRTVLELGGVTDVTALEHVNLQLKAGDRLGLIGHNGSGKTTLLRALSGAYEPDEGTIDVHGRIAALLDLGLGIDPSATGYENIRLRGRIAGLSSREIEAKMERDTYMTALEAKEFGLVDEVVQSRKEIPGLSDMDREKAAKEGAAPV